MKIKAKGKTEFERFENTLDALPAVPHGEIKAKLGPNFFTARGVTPADLLRTDSPRRER
jgi:hypothetical protein